MKTSDFVIESFSPGQMEKLGLGYSALNNIRNGIILTSISPYGQQGPYRDYKSSDMVLMGMAGMLYLTGDADRPPVNISIPQAYLLAGADAAVGTMIAYYHRKMAGEGQHVDISIQQSMAWFLAAAIPHWELNEIILERVGTLRSGISRDIVQRQVWPCKDGYVFFHMTGGITGAKTCRQLVKWMDDEGMGDEYLRAMEWEKFDMGNATQDMIDRISKPLEAFFLIHTKKEILKEAVKRGMSVCPLSSMEDLLNDENLKARNFWVEIEHPELEACVTYPSQFIRSSEEVFAIRSRAPLIGEHNEEVYSDLGLYQQDLVMLKEAGVI